MPSELTTLLGDTSLTWTERRTRLQGWSGPEARQADATPGGQRIAAAVCAVGAFASAVTGSPLVLAMFAATAMRTPRHPDQVPHDLLETARP